jgi:membrane protein
MIDLDNYKRRFLDAVQSIPLVHRSYLLLQLLIRDILDLDVLRNASAMAYTSLTSLVPVLAAVFSVMTLFQPLMGEDGSMVNMARDFILSNLTTGAGEKAVEYLQGFIAGSDMTKVGVAGGLMGFFLLISLLRQIELLFNKIWSVEKDRNLLVRFMYFWTFLTLGLFLSSIVVSLLTEFRFGDLSQHTEHLFGMKVFTQLVSWGAKILFCFLLYKIVPNC